MVLYGCSKEMTSVSFCEHELGIQKTTVINWNNFLREVCAAEMLAHPVVIGGPGRVVEADELLFSRRKNHQGLVLPQQWVLGGIDCQSPECFMYAVPDRSRSTLLLIIQKVIAPGTTIMSDMWTAYVGINAMGFGHLQVDHTYNFVDPQTDAHTQNIENSWKNAKQRNKRQHSTRSMMLESYLCKWMWQQRFRNVDL